MSFASPGTTIGTRLEFTAKSLISRVSLSFSAYGVLNNEANVETLIVAGQDRGEMYCESYEMNSDSYEVNSGWTSCASPPSTDVFMTSIVWWNQFVALSNRNYLFVYNHNPTGGEWSTKNTRIPNLLGWNPFFLNANNHLCKEGEMLDEENTVRKVFCLADLAESAEWIQTPLVSATVQLTLMGTLSAKIISSMIKANQGS